MKEKLQFHLASWWKRLLIFLAAFSILLFIFMPAFGFTDSRYAVGTLGGTLLFILLWLSATIFIESNRADGRWFTAGLKFDPFTGRDIFKGLFFALIGIAVFFVLNIALGKNMIFHENILSDSLPDFMEFTLLILLLAFLEELFFRGIIFQALVERFNPVFISILISCAFALAHYNNEGIGYISLANIFLAGMLFSTMYIQTKSLWLPVSFHFFWNWGQAVFLGSPISGWKSEMALISFGGNANGASEGAGVMEMILGGEFGIEESITAGAILIILILLTIKAAKTSPYMSSVLFKRAIAESALRDRKNKKEAQANA